MNINPFQLGEVAEAAVSKKIVSEFTHDFYNYPARFSPLLVREIIKTFTERGDLVLDPFMGGGTTLVEAKMLRRHSIGFDISSLANFITKVKTTNLSKSNVKKIGLWADLVVPNLKCTGSYSRPIRWIENGYLRNCSEKSVWPLRILMEKFVYEIERSDFPPKVKNFLRAALLKTGQWALDSKKAIPTTVEFRSRLLENILVMSRVFPLATGGKSVKVMCRHGSAENIHLDKSFGLLGIPKLIVTSPPYPGVHVMYHRWQINGRRETPLPFWIADSQDGHGLSYYTMGGRAETGLKSYFENIKQSFTSIRKICASNTIVVQVIAFSDPEWQLKKYLETMETAGFSELELYSPRLWRNVPNRKWYAQQKGDTHSSKEVVLFHKPK